MVLKECLGLKGKHKTNTQKNKQLRIWILSSKKEKDLDPFKIIIHYENDEMKELIKANKRRNN